MANLFDNSSEEEDGTSKTIAAKIQGDINQRQKDQTDLLRKGISGATTEKPPSAKYVEWFHAQAPTESKDSVHHRIGNNPWDAAAGNHTHKTLDLTDWPTGGTSGQLLANNGAGGTIWSSTVPGHSHSGADITSGTLGVARGGTGVTTGAGLVPIIPTSATYGTGSGSISSNGLVTFANTTVLKALSCFTSTYSRYRIYLDIQSSSTNDYVYWRGLDAAGTQNATSAYYTGSMYQQSGVVGAFDNGNTVQTYSRVGYAVNDDAHSLIMDIFNPFQTRKTKGTFVSQYSATGLTNLSGAYNFNATTSFSGIQFAPFSTAGGWTGTLRIFGVL